MRKRPDIPEKFRPFVNNYKINVFEIAYLSREQVNVFKSDFRVVADYFVQKRENGDYIPDPQELKHVQETLQLLSVMTGDHRFENAYNEKGAPIICVTYWTESKTEAGRKAYWKDARMACGRKKTRSSSVCIKAMFPGM